MKKILYVDSDTEFVEDLDMRKMIDMEEDYILRTVKSIVDISQNVNIFKPDLIVLSYNILKKQDTWNINQIPIAYFAKNREELEAGAVYGFKTIGFTDDPVVLIKKLGEEPYFAALPERKKEKPEKHKESEKAEAQSASLEKSDIKKRESEKPEKIVHTEPPKIKKNKVYMPMMELETLEEEEPLYPDMQISEEIAEEEPAAYETEDVIEREFQKDLHGKKNGTKVVAVYSAKGGVGKTTIATELAVYLSLVNLGRRRLRVCIVDYNIDFGDVRATLSVEASSHNLTYWAAEVQEYRKKGKKDIHYSKEDMEDWMCRDEKSGLYVVSAPLTNEESMMIESEDLKVILDNIIENGEFDYVICDTGNNTRDSTMIALERADVIFMIMTQNVNTANCDKAFLETMKTIDFDLSNIRLVINNIMPAKATSITVQEIIDFFPYECVGKIKFNMDVIKAANLGEPLAFQPDHEITRQMRSLVQYLLNNKEFDIEKKKKKNIWNFFFRRG